MDISAISSIVSGLSDTGSAKKTTSTSFSDMFGEALQGAQQTDSQVQMANADLLTGQTDDLHTPVIEAQKAELSLNLAIQIRNKVIEAYNEVMGMQI